LLIGTVLLISSICPKDGAVALVATGVVVAALTVKLAVLVPVPAAVITATGPVVAPTGTTATMVVALTTWKLAGVLLKSTAVTLVKPVPLSVTLAPTAAEGGKKPVRVGPRVGWVVAGCETTVVVPVPTPFIRAMSSGRSARSA
jgi:hypothetical protein